MPQPLPSRLYELDISHNPITQWPEDSPLGLDSIDISSTQIKDLPEVWVRHFDGRIEKSVSFPDHIFPRLIAPNLVHLFPPHWASCRNCDFGSEYLQNTAPKRAKHELLNFDAQIKDKKLKTLLLHAISQCEQDVGWALNNSSLVNQLLYTSHERKDQHALAEQLYNCCLQHDAVRDFAAAVQTVLASEDDHSFYIFITEDGQLKLLAITSEGFAKFVMRNQTEDTDTTWTSSLLVSDGSGGAELLHNFKALAPFPLLQNAYNDTIASETFKTLLAKYNWSDTLRRRFEAALQMRVSTGGAKNFTEEENQELATALVPLLHLENSEIAGITEAHLQQILTMLTVPNLPENQAAFLLALSTVFVKLSSSAMFGTELDSPETIRHYAYALLLQARKMYSPLMADDVFGDYKNRMIGGCDAKGKMAFTCTSILSGMMLQSFIKQMPDKPFLKQAYNSVIPAAWR